MADEPLTPIEEALARALIVSLVQELREELGLGFDERDAIELRKSVTADLEERRLRHMNQTKE